FETPDAGDAAGGVDLVISGPNGTPILTETFTYRALPAALEVWHAADYPGSGQVRGGKLGVMDLQLGSDEGADSADPIFVPQGPWFWLPGVAGNGLSVADNDVLDVAGDLTILGWFQPSNWTPGVHSALLSKWQTSG